MPNSPNRKPPQEPLARYKLIEAITAPLGFFVLALLIVESFLAAVLIGANLRADEKMSGVYIGVGMFVLVILTVALFVWFKPENLTYDKEAHLINHGKAKYGTKGKPAVKRDDLVPTEADGKGGTP